MNKERVRPEPEGEEVATIIITRLRAGISCQLIVLRLMAGREVANRTATGPVRTNEGAGKKRKEEKREGKREKGRERRNQSIRGNSPSFFF